jgi:hypothetical protein
MALRQTPSALALMDAAELLIQGRVIAGSGLVAHGAQFARRKQLQLPHDTIIAPPTDNYRPRPPVDHAILVGAVEITVRAPVVALIRSPLILAPMTGRVVYDSV